MRLCNSWKEDFVDRLQCGFSNAIWWYYYLVLVLVLLWLSLRILSGLGCKTQDACPLSSSEFDSLERASRLPVDSSKPGNITIDGGTSEHSLQMNERIHGKHGTPIWLGSAPKLRWNTERNNMRCSPADSVYFTEAQKNPPNWKKLTYNLQIVTIYRKFCSVTVALGQMSRYDWHHWKLVELKSSCIIVSAC
jgi:hypothetical protein